MDVAGARVLITHPIISRIMGSTVVALELADYLMQRGADVLLYAAHVADPAQRLFVERGIRTVDGDDPALGLSSFDLVWVHSQVLPPSFLRELETVGSEPRPTFVFNHMSSLDAVADEFPYIRGLEESLSSLSLYVSNECRATVEVVFDTPPPGLLFANPAPIDYVELDLPRSPQLRSLLIISNHRPTEVDDAAALLSAKGVRVLRLGEGGDRVELVTPEPLSQFDAVMTIGKTVQYCLVSATPVYVYDHFGGPGYLDSANVENAATHNFSGRGFATRSAADLCSELIDGYSAAVAFQQRQRGAFIERFALDEVAPRVLAAIRPRELGPIDSRTVKSYLAAQRFGSRFYQMWGERNQLQDRLSQLEEQARTAATECEAARADAAALRASWSFRIGFFLTRPVAFIHHVVVRLLRRSG